MSTDNELLHSFKELEDGISMLRLQGELNSLHEDKVRKIVGKALKKSGFRLIIEFSRVPFTNSAGTGLILSAFTTARKHGGKIVLLNPTGMVLELFVLVGLPKVVEIKHNIDEAIACFGPEHRKKKS